MQSAIPIRDKVPKFRAIMFHDNHIQVIDLLGANGQKWVLTNSPNGSDLVVHMHDGEPVVVKSYQYVVVKGRDIEVLDSNEYFRKYEIDPEAKQAERAESCDKMTISVPLPTKLAGTLSPADDLHLRHQALDYAIRAHAPAPDAGSILPAARDYLAFLRGRETAGSAKA